MPELPLAQLIQVPAPVAPPHQESRLFQLGHDALDRPLGDADELGDEAQRQPRLGDQPQHVEMIGEKTPGRRAHAAHPARVRQRVQKIATDQSGLVACCPVTSGSSSGSSMEGSTILGSSGKGGGGCSATTTAACLPMSSSRGISPVVRLISFSSVWKKRSRKSASFSQPTVMQ